MSEITGGDQAPSPSVELPASPSPPATDTAHDSPARDAAVPAEAADTATVSPASPSQRREYDPLAALDADTAPDETHTAEPAPPADPISDDRAHGDIPERVTQPAGHAGNHVAADDRAPASEPTSPGAQDADAEPSPSGDAPTPEGPSPPSPNDDSRATPPAVDVAGRQQAEVAPPSDDTETPELTDPRRFEAAAAEHGDVSDGDSTIDAAHRPAGAGGGWETINEQPGGAVPQLTEHSCGSACADMISNGEVSQQQVWEQAGDGAWSPTIAGKLNELSQHSWQGGCLDESEFDNLNAHAPWAAELYEGGRESHLVVVDGVDDEGRIAIRDPWGAGSTYLMERNEFMRVWNRLAVFRR